MQEADASEIDASPNLLPISGARFGKVSPVRPGSVSVRSSSRVKFRRPLRILGLRVIAAHDVSFNAGTSSCQTAPNEHVQSLRILDSRHCEIMDAQLTNSNLNETERRSVRLGSGK